MGENADDHMVGMVMVMVVMVMSSKTLFGTFWWMLFWSLLAWSKVDKNPKYVRESVYLFGRARWRWWRSQIV